MRNQVKQLIIGTTLEPIARRLYAAIRPKNKADERNRHYDLQTLEVMKRVLTQDSNCVDVGCHQGSVLREMLRFAPKGTHFAFEPIPDLYETLVESFPMLPNVRFYNVALSDTTGTATFQHVVSNPAYSGLRKRKYDRPNEELHEIVVTTALLDDIITDDISIRFIKVDVEGAELQVFRGATATLKRNRPVIVFEHGLGGADSYGTTPDDIYDLLFEECGLRLFLMAEWLASNGKASLSKQEFSDHFWKQRNFYFMAY